METNYEDAFDKVMFKDEHTRTSIYSEDAFDYDSQFLNDYSDNLVNKMIELSKQGFIPKGD